MADAIIIFVTTSSKEEAREIAKGLVGAKLVACVNIVDAIQSIFWWQGKVCEEEEGLMIIKSIKANLRQVIAKVKELHSYDVPEIIALPIIDGSKEYLDWVRGETTLA